MRKIVPRGFGLAFADGLTVFVPLAAPRDTLRVKINELRGKTAFAEIEQVLEPSPSRIAPACEYYGTCGGCDLQHLSYQAQLDAKVEIIKDALRRIGKLDIDRDISIVKSPRPFGYRSRAQWHLDTRSRKIGYVRRGSHEVVDVGRCPILDPVLEETLVELRADLDWESFWREKSVIEAAVGADEKISLSSRDLAEPEPVSFEAAGERFTFDAASFFQGNSSLVDRLVEVAIAGAEGQHALDLYCGVGLFALPLARKFNNVSGVEASEHAVRFAIRNARDAGIENARFFRSGAGEFLSTRNVGPADFVLLDPPRSGTERGVIDGILRLRPGNISYVSCDPAMLARDLRVLADGGYDVDSITALDLFPQTHHVETVVRMSRQGV